jgi:sterol desaturase/sphingolipid hydroxylase (fatty acid hydroxylase superfamily)
MSAIVDNRKRQRSLTFRHRRLARRRHVRGVSDRDGTAATLHLRVGGVASASMFAHAQIALNGLWLGFLAMHYLVAPFGVWPAYGLGLCVCIAWSGVLWAVRRKHRPA